MTGPVRLTEKDRDSLLQVVNSVFRDPKKPSSRMEDEYVNLFHPDNLHNFLAILDGNRIVADVGVIYESLFINGAKLKTAEIGSVATLPEYRGKGLATQLVETAFKNAREENADIMLISGGRNLYQRIGCAPCGKYQEWTVRSERKANLPGGIVVKQYQEKHFPKVHALRAQEPTRIGEDEKRLKNILALTVFEKMKQMSYSIFMQNELRTFICLAVGENKCTVREFFGSRQAVVDVLPFLLAENNLEEAVITTTIFDKEMFKRLVAKNYNSSERAFLGTVKIINIVQCIQKLKPFFKATGIDNLMGFQENGRLGFQIGDERIEFNSQREHLMMHILFDHPKGINWSMLEASERSTSLLKTVFPLPLPDYGIYYI